MDLKTYISEQGCSLHTFGQQVGVTQSAVSRWLCGNRSPSPAMMRKIMEATNGAVTPNDFFELPTKEDAA